MFLHERVCHLRNVREGASDMAGTLDFTKFLRTSKSVAVDSAGVFALYDEATETKNSLKVLAITGG